MGDKSDKNKHKHDKQAMIAKADAETGNMKFSLLSLFYGVSVFIQDMQ